MNTIQPEPPAQPPAVFLMGPTASGKSGLAVKLAHALNGEIISVDSALVYRDMNIGTAKPTQAEREGITHHLIDILDPRESFSTGQFKTQTYALIADISRRGKLPILAGGTMLYFNALSNLAPLPEADESVRAKLDQQFAEFGKDAMHQRLALIDPESAARIHPNDPQRLQRALEVYELTGKPLSRFFQEAQASPLPFNPIKLVVAPPDRKLLHEQIAKRFRHMLAQGLVEEVEALYRRGDLTEKMPAIRAVGYRQVWAYLKGEDDYTAMTEKAIAATRQLAKRQFTWLRRETEAAHFNSDDAALLSQMLAHIEAELNHTAGT
ncbi:MAG: tRNA (adenosine(37)-N6)-dimethylallyltransferase MiaA [Methylobacter sp.]|nr:MAG: tRNA (adenosine(37)-N6)-dimethylallyltransferase MiaA [Methylobacter sp.]